VTFLFKSPCAPLPHPLVPLCLRVFVSRLLFFLIVVFACCVFSHDGPEHVIEELTLQLEQKKSADLYHKRAIEYRQLSEYKKAITDLREALKINPRHFEARLELAQVLITVRKTDEALKVLRIALAAEQSAAKRLAIFGALALAYDAAGDVAAAIHYCASALELAPDDLDLLLLRSELFWRAGAYQRRAEDLESAFRRTGSAILRADWIDAMLDAGHFSAVKSDIEKEIAESRLKSAWLIRRARCSAAESNSAASHGDISAALLELDSRIRPHQPDTSLLLQRAHARALSADKARAQADLKAAARAGAAPHGLARISSIIKNMKR